MQTQREESDRLLRAKTADLARQMQRDNLPCFSRFLDILRCRGRVRLSGFHKEIETEGPAFSMVGRFFANGGLLEKVRK